ncbi:MAG: Na+/H+ antiporter subunit E [Opitutaceae bacterium]
MYRILTFCLLFLLWLVLSGLFDAFHLTLGIISCGLVTWLSSDFLFEDRSVTSGNRIRQFARLPGYSLWLLYQIFLANLYVLRIALRPAGIGDLRPQVVRFKTHLKTDFAKFVFASSITLTPGTVTIRIDGDEFFVHAISEYTALGLEGEMEKRIAAVWEPDLKL